MNPSIPIACFFALAACEQAEVHETESAAPTLQVDAVPADEAAQCEEPSTPASFWPSGRQAGADEFGPEQPAHTSLARDAPSSPGIDRNITLADVVILTEPVDLGSAAVGAVSWHAAIAQPREDTPRAEAE